MHDEADREFRALIEEVPDSIASFHIGLIGLRRGEWAAAVNAFMTAAPNAPSKIALLHNLSLAYERLGQIEKAKLVIERALAAGGSRQPLIQLQAAIVALRNGDLQAAKVALSEARSLWTATPPPVWFHYAARVAKMTGDPEREMLLLSAATETHPESPILLNNLAAASLERGDYDHARVAAEKGITVAPELPQLRRNLAAALEGISATKRAQAAQSANRS
jgi:tetratricopeptide (TPR) repeat protein